MSKYLAGVFGSLLAGNQRTITGSSLAVRAWYPLLPARELADKMKNKLDKNFIFWGDLKSSYTSVCEIGNENVFAKWSVSVLQLRLIFAGFVNLG